MTSESRLSPTGSAPTYAPTEETEDSHRRNGSSTRRYIRSVKGRKDKHVDLWIQERACPVRHDRIQLEGIEFPCFYRYFSLKNSQIKLV